MLTYVMTAQKKTQFEKVRGTQGSAVRGIVFCD
jgi:hypothetical protein